MGVNSFKYSLKGIVNYRGNFEESHYWTIIKINGIWYEFNDSIIRKKHNIEFQNSTAVFLVYEKYKIIATNKYNNFINII